MNRRLRPHDLLLLDETASVRAVGAPAWVLASLHAAPWVVVRRGAAPEAHVAVGVRGHERCQRWAWAVPRRAVRDRRAPEDLVDVGSTSRDGIPALAALPDVRLLLQSRGLLWGPTGSVGFELATGRATATPSSDLDVQVRVPELTADALVRLEDAHRVLERLPVQVDCQVALPGGTIALAELVGGGRTVLVRTCSGPALVGREDLLP